MFRGFRLSIEIESETQFALFLSSNPSLEEAMDHEMFKTEF